LGSAAAFSLVTVAVLWRSIPQILAIPTHIDLENANRQLSAVLESTTVLCVLTMDSEWKITYMNANAKALLNVLGDLYGMTFWDAFPALDPSTPAKLHKVMATRESESYEDRYEPLDLSTSVQVHPWDHGGITIFFNDVREQKRLQRALEAERALRDQRIEVLARLSGELGHEIKNPLSIIRARACDLAELAESGEGVTPEEVAKTCGSIVKTSDRAIRILRGLEELAHQGTRDPMMTAEISAVVEQAIELVQRRYETHGIRLESVVPPGLPTIECREVQIGQILMNLLTNAFDAIDADPKSERWVRIEVSTERSTEDATERLLIDVVDGGPGVAEHNREHVMDRFFTTKPMGAGIGIGLSVSRTIAEDHGGRLELRNADGHTCFRLILPVRAARSEREAA
jgi:signal transduction histidine kinase